MTLSKMTRTSVLILISFSILAVRALSSSEKGKLLTPEQGCGITDKVPIPRIIGGTTPKIGAFPWMALIGYSYGGGYSFNCGGSLITSRHVLTAAHSINPNLHLVRLGEHDITTNSDGPVQDIKVVKIDRHVNYSKARQNNDIAILTLERDVEFSNRIKPICLPKDQPARRQNIVGSKCIVAGWGLTKPTYEGGRGSKILQQLQLPIIPGKHCERVYSNFRNDTQICVGNLGGGNGGCKGDSGSPLMLPLPVNGTFPFYQVGVVNYGGHCHQKNVPESYANVQYFMDWIESKINDSQSYKVNSNSIVFPDD